MVQAAILIPNRSDGGRRDELLKWTTDRLSSLHPNIPIYIGNHDDGPFNRSRAINLAAAQAPDADVYVVADSDSFVGREQLEQAIEQAFREKQMVLAYTTFNYLNAAMSAKVMSGFEGDWRVGVDWTLTDSCSSMVAIPRSLYLEVGGFDEGFVGWGGEDYAFAFAVAVIGNGIGKIPGDVWHLWHPISERSTDSHWYDRMVRYSEVAHDKQQMVELLTTLKGEL